MLRTSRTAPAVQRCKSQQQRSSYGRDRVHRYLDELPPSLVNASALEVVQVWGTALCDDGETPNLDEIFDPLVDAKVIRCCLKALANVAGRDEMGCLP